MAVPAGVLLAGATEIYLTGAVPMPGPSTLATACCSPPPEGPRLSNTESFGLLVVRGGFPVWVVAETVGVLTFAPE